MNELVGFSVENAIVLLYLSCSARDIDWLRDDLEQILSTQGIDTQLHQLLHHHCTPQLVNWDTVDTADNADLPWDPRWFQQLCLRHFAYSANDENERSQASNRYYILFVTTFCVCFVFCFCFFFVLPKVF